MGIKSNVAPLVPATTHLAAALKAGQNASSLQNEILLNIVELTTKLTIWVGTMQAGDPNIAVVNAQIAALS